MTNRLDEYLSQAIKGWADHYSPPANGRARLLLLASTSTNRTVHTPSFRSFERTPLSRFQQGLAGHAFEAFNNSWLFGFHLA